MIKVLIVGQTPPPYHGQALMIERLVQSKFSRVQLFHVRMAFSDSIGDIGRFRFGKVLHLLNVILRIVWHRIVHGTTILYYPPAGPNRVPVYRDLIILGCTRWMFRRTVFHFHVMGVADVCRSLSRPLQRLARQAFYDVDAAILLVGGVVVRCAHVPATQRLHCAQRHRGRVSAFLHIAPAAARGARAARRGRAGTECQFLRNSAGS